MAQGDSMAVTPPVVVRDWRTPLELLVLGAIWGSSFLFMRIAANPFGPFALVEVRLALGALVLLPFLWRERAQFSAGMWPRLALIGAINSAIPFLLFAWAAQRSPAAIGAICNAMTVLFAAMVGFLFFGQKIGLRRSLALLVGYRDARPLSADQVRLLADLLPVVHLDFALSEVEYFHAITGSRANADVAYRTFLLGHADWFRTPAGQGLLATLRGAA